MPYVGPKNEVFPRKKVCNHGGQHYERGEIWNIPMKKDAGDNNCAECTCNVSIQMFGNFLLPSVLPKS